MSRSRGVIELGLDGAGLRSAGRAMRASGLHAQRHWYLQLQNKGEDSPAALVFGGRLLSATVWFGGSNGKGGAEVKSYVVPCEQTNRHCKRQTTHCLVNCLYYLLLEKTHENVKTLVVVQWFECRPR